MISYPLELIDELYSAFSAPVPEVVLGCPCCTDPVALRKLVEVPLRQLTADDLEDYTTSALSTVGGDEDLRYFWPRLVELALKGELDTPEVLFDKPRQAEWRTSWSDAQQRATLDVAATVIRSLIAADAEPEEVDTWVCAPPLGRPRSRLLVEHVYLARTDPVPTLATRVRTHYERAGAAPRPGVSPAAILAFETARGILLPPPVAEFHRTFDGLGVLPLDLDFLAAWPLAELTRVSDGVAAFRGVPDYGPIVEVLPDAANYIAFGDGLVWSHVLAFRLENGGTRAGEVVWICGGTWTTVAPSYEAFWERYLEEPASVLMPQDV